jgi:Na+/proline symporter
VHTVIIYGCLLATMFTVYATSPLIGSPGRMYDLLVEASKTVPGPSTGQDGSWLTIRNVNSLLTGITIAVGGFSTVFVDPSYGQKAIAAAPMSALWGYITGGLFWLIVPWSLGSSAGLAAIALTNNPVFPTYPRVMTPSEIGQGLVVPYALTALLGKSGAAMALIMVSRRIKVILSFNFHLTAVGDFLYRSLCLSRLPLLQNSSLAP